MDLPAHRPRLAGVLAVGVGVVRLEEHLILLALPANRQKISHISHVNAIEMVEKYEKKKERVRYLKAQNINILKISI